MYVIIWEYQEQAKRIAEFEDIYSAAGAWAKLFQKSKGYLGTELLADDGHPHRYLTIDRWTSSREFASFLSVCKIDYDDLDAQCEGLTERETLLGTWETVLRETH